MATKTAKFHHYVPQFMLRRFAKERRPGKYFANVFDKSNGRTFPANVDSIFGETHFNRVETSSGVVSVEDNMTSIESAAAPIIDRILSEISFKSVSESDFATLCIFVALQMNRGTGARNVLEDMINQLRGRIAEIVGEDNLPDEIKDASSENEKKKMGIVTSLDDLQEYAKTFAAKDCRLMIAPDGHEFIIGDNPVAITNSTPQDGLWSNLGLLCKGIEIYLPLSPKITLAFWCPTIADYITDNVKRFRLQAANMRERSVIIKAELAVTLTTLADDIDQRTDELENKHGKLLLETIELNEQNVKRQNALQVSHAERFLISKNADFDLPREMLRRDPRYVRGRRMQMT
ncbi:DUF4238 domain-containing protein [Mesorhizobium sp. M0106]|uniref:DUF4238 domain-containing protein n=1 Tax=Mesorhizobium sp. M0106 TaxID=2956880 RepID=UPI003337A445